jgi:hypothetical protein
VRKEMTLLVCLAVAASLAACGGGGGGGNVTTPSVPAGPSQASIVVTQNGQGQVCLSPLADFNYRLRLPIRIAESAGLGANMNFFRLSLLRAGVEVERREATANTIISGLGTNRLAASGNITATLTMDFNSDSFDTARFAFSFTDDKGNNLQANFDLPPSNVSFAVVCTI